MRLVLLILAIALSCLAQRTDTIFYEVAAGITTTAPSYTYTSTPLRNNGQTQHLLTVVFRDNGANVCQEQNWQQGSDWTINGLEIVGRNAGMTQSISITNEIIRRNVPNADAAQRAVYLVYGYGAYQELAARLRFTSTNCTATLYYAGTLFPLPPLTKDVLASNTSPQGYTVHADQYTCGNGQGYYELIPDTSTRATDIIGFYASRTTLGTITLQRLGSGGSPILAPDFVFNLNSGTPIVLPLSDRSLFYVPPATSLRISCSGSGGTTYFVWWERAR